MTTENNSFTPNEKFSPRFLYDIYRIQIHVRDMLCGGKPKNDELLDTHLKVKTGYNDEQTKAQLEELKSVKPVTEEDIEEEAKKSSVGFLQDEHGLFLQGMNVKAMFKESGSMLDIYRKKLGSKQIFQHGFEVKLSQEKMKELGVTRSDRIYLGKMKPDGSMENVVHATTPKGKVTSIKRIDYVTDVTLDFEVWILHTHPTEKRHVAEDVLQVMIVFAQENGLGADRSQGQGKFDIISFEQIQKGQNPVLKAVNNEEEKPAAKGKKGKKAEEEADAAE